ncbi:MAG: tRNA pseudouridine(38-40) synthase TruA [Verrucomicrobiota bacterium]|nr:tRNA pseudouridine(38-40) synthase TruA [Verrucomicrobiota bacterium]
MTVKEKSISRWKCLVVYNGTAFHGWQSQPGGNSIQDHLEKRLQEIFERPVRVHGSGRTDAGVHALGQVFHFEADWRHGAKKLLAAFGAGLPSAIQLRSVRKIPPSFHARFSATGKIYFYNLFHGGRADPFIAPFCWSISRRLDVKAMRAAAARLAGRHDFRAYSAFTGEEKNNTVRRLRRLEITGRGPRLRVTLEADGFLYKMARSLVGALVAVGLGKASPGELVAILRSHERTHRVATAPAQGLFLAKVLYR